MNENYTHISMVIDRSGSMTKAWPDVIGGYATLIEDNKKLDDKCTFTVACFDDKYELVEDFTDIKNVTSDLRVYPRGSTALLDSIGKTINHVGAKLAALPEGDRPMKVIMIIQTDGFENASHEFNKEMIKTMIDEQTTKYNWQFQFIGADLDAVKEAASWGINVANTSTYNKNDTGSTISVLSEKLSKARRSKSHAEYTCNLAFSEKDKAKMNSTNPK